MLLTRPFLFDEYLGAVGTVHLFPLFNPQPLSRTDPIALQNGFSRPHIRGKQPQAHASQDREFGHMKDAIDIPNKDNDLVTIFLL